MQKPKAAHTTGEVNNEGLAINSAALVLREAVTGASKAAGLRQASTLKVALGRRGGNKPFN